MQSALAEHDSLYCWYEVSANYGFVIESFKKLGARPKKLERSSDEYRSISCALNSHFDPKKRKLMSVIRSTRFDKSVDLFG